VQELIMISSRLKIHPNGSCMTDTQTLMAAIYSAFNRRDTQGALAFMSENVSWPKASEGRRVVGKGEIRAYWSRQWEEFDPQVEPIEVIDRRAGHTDVRVRQIVKNLDGEVLFDGEVWHSYTIAGGLIERMDLRDRGANSEMGPSSAFSRPSK
jgi:SnoaL-like domain